MVQINGSSPVRHQTVTYNNAYPLVLGHLETHFNDNLHQNTTISIEEKCILIRHLQNGDYFASASNETEMPLHLEGSLILDYSVAYNTWLWWFIIVTWSWRDGVWNDCLTIVCSTVYWGADERKHQSSALLASVQGIHRWPMISPHKWPVTRKMYPFNDVIMCKPSVM